MQLTVPGVSGRELGALQPACAHRLEAAAQRMWGREALDLRAPTSTVPLPSQAPPLILPVPSVTEGGEGAAEGCDQFRQVILGLEQLRAPS